MATMMNDVTLMDKSYEKALDSLKVLRDGSGTCSLSGQPWQLEAVCLAAGDSLEKNSEWRRAWEVLFGLVKWLGQGIVAPPHEEAAYQADETALRLYAHASMRAANILTRVHPGIPDQDVVDLCDHLCASSGRTLAIACASPRKHLPTARKLLEWLVHVAISRTVVKAPGLEVQCWQRARRAFSQASFGNQGIKALSYGRTSLEQLQLLRSICQLTRQRRLAPEVAQLVTEVLQALLKLAPLTWGGLAPPEKEAASKVLATALEALTVSLPATTQQSTCVLDWADDFLEQLADCTGPVDRNDASMPPWQMLFSLVARARIQQMEDFRRANTQPVMQRYDALETWRVQLAHQLQELAGEPGAEKDVLTPDDPGPCAALLRIAGLAGDARRSALFCHCGLQTLESLRLQLPPGPTCALLCLRQLQAHHTALRSPDLTVPWRAAHAAALARLLLSQAQEPDFAAALRKCGLSRRLALKAVDVQLERCVQLLPAADSGLEVGRLRLLQAQALQHAQLADGDGGMNQEPVHVVVLALEAWSKLLSLAPAGLSARTPGSVGSALRAAKSAPSGASSGPSLILLLRDASDAAHLLESMDLHALAVRALVLCLACLHHQHGESALWWLPHPDEELGPTRRCAQACVVLLYRMAAALGRWASSPAGEVEAQEAAVRWWQVAEAAWSKLGEGEASQASAIQRIIAFSSMPEQSRMACNAGSAWENVLTSTKSAITVAARGGALPQQWLHIVEALWALAKCTVEWQEQPCQCPGGSAVTAQCAALTSLMLLFKNHSKARTIQTHRKVPEASDASEETLTRWPAFRSGLLQLRVLHQVSCLYRWLGDADLADACSQCGLQLMSQRLCGDRLWKLRFLCTRARCELAQPSPSPEPAVAKEAGTAQLETRLPEIDALLSERKGGQQPHEPGDSDSRAPSAVEGPPWELLELWAENAARCGDLRDHLPKNLQGNLQEGEEGAEASPCNSSAWRLALKAAAAQRRSGRSGPEGWRSCALRFLDWLLALPENQPLPPHLGQSLLLLAQGIFEDFAGRGEEETGLLDVGVLASCGRELARDRRPVLQPEHTTTIRDAIQDASASGQLAAVLYLAAAAFRDSLATGDSAALRASAKLLLRAAEAYRSSSGHEVHQKAREDACEGRSRSRSPRHPQGSAQRCREHWSLCKQVIPMCSAVSLLFLMELRAMQREVETLSQHRMLEYLFSQPHLDFAPGVGVGQLASGDWLADVRPDMSLAWLQADWQSQALRITRSLDEGLGVAAHGVLVSQEVPLPPGLLQSLQELRSLHALNGQKIRELWQREDKSSEAVRREFWTSRKGFDSELGRIAEKVQQEILGPWRFLLAAWPQTDHGRQALLAAVHAWIDEVSADGVSLLARSGGWAECFAGIRADPQQRFLLALLFLDAENLQACQIALVLEALWPGRPSQLRRLAASLKRCRTERRAAFDARGSAVAEAPLLLYVDAIVAQLPLEACSCLRHRKVVRGLAPNMTLTALTRVQGARPTTGYFIIDPAEDCTNMADVRQLLASWSTDGQSWHGHTGRPMPASKQVLEELCCNDVFIYLGHGERARQLLRQEELQLATPSASQGSSEESSQESSDASESAKRGLRSILMLLGCSSVKVHKTSQVRWGDFESFGFAGSALLGGAPLVLGAQWDVLGGDLDRLASRLLQDWLRGASQEVREGLLSSLRSLRPRCMLPNLTGAAMVCYGIPM